MLEYLVIWNEPFIATCLKGLLAHLIDEICWQAHDNSKVSWLMVSRGFAVNPQTL